jgi:hypothetical protein
MAHWHVSCFIEHCSNSKTLTPGRTSRHWVLGPRIVGYNWRPSVRDFSASAKTRRSLQLTRRSRTIFPALNSSSAKPFVRCLGIFFFFVAAPVVSRKFSLTEREQRKKSVVGYKRGGYDLRATLALTFGAMAFFGLLRGPTLRTSFTSFAEVISCAPCSMAKRVSISRCGSLIQVSLRKHRDWTQELVNLLYERRYELAPVLGCPHGLSHLRNIGLQERIWIALQDFTSLVICRWIVETIHFTVCKSHEP